MTLSNSRDSVPYPPLQLNGTERKLTQSQADLMSEALRRGAADVRNAVAYRLNEPLTALLLCLHEIRQVVEHPISIGDVLTSVRRMSEMALLQAGRIYQIVAPEADRPKASLETGVECGDDRVDLFVPNRGVIGNNRQLEPSSPPVQCALTPREYEVLALIAEGKSGREDGVHLGISERTFEIHRAHIMREFGTRTAAELLRMALGSPKAIDPTCIGPTGATTAYSARASMPSGLSA